VKKNHVGKSVHREFYGTVEKFRIDRLDYTQLDYTSLRRPKCGLIRKHL